MRTAINHHEFMQCLIGAGLDLAQLGIVAAKKCWLLHIDALIIGADGSLADATSLAVKVRPRD
jgi:exosome complex RNA-binding protein Rrp42 (RNase PH superfamily)